jgi:ribosome-binding factor A
MKQSRRQKRVSSLIKSEISRLLFELPQEDASTLISIMNVDMSSDLKTAYITLSVYGNQSKEKILDAVNERAGYLRKSIASTIKLKYNPLLIFSLDPTAEYEKRIDNLIDRIKENE